MDAENIRRKVREDFWFLFDSHGDSVLGVLLYGSVVKAEFNERSDIDICVVAPAAKDKIGFSRWFLSNVKR